jgi:hypothetical protein
MAGDGRRQLSPQRGDNLAAVEARAACRDVGRRVLGRGHPYENVRNDVKLASGDSIDLKMYGAAMRHIKADQSEKVSAFDDLSLVQFIVERDAAAVDARACATAGSTKAISTPMSACLPT